MTKRNLLCLLQAIAFSVTLHPNVQAQNNPQQPASTIASSNRPEPRINGPKVVGTTPGKPFSFLIPASGEAPLAVKVSTLPLGLSFDSTTHVLSGTLKKAGTYRIQVEVSNAHGSNTRELRIVAGEGKLALTPPLGWNSWQPYAGKVSDRDVRANADALVSSGLASHGYSVVTIDDGWEGRRNAQGELGTNDRFPDMKSLADHVHAKGLKFGIYSSPGPLTCQRYPGSYQHESQDAQTFAKWGVDYLKYDLCSLRYMLDRRNAEAQKAPYALMAGELRKQPRDIVYSVCQYGWSDVWKWGQSVGGNLWRTTDDIGDAWSTVANNGFGEKEHAQYAGPGHWNDPDMLVVGQVGPGWGAQLHPSLLTPDEQISHISLWAMSAAPLIVGCDVTKMDPWTKDLLCNDEILDVDQDPLGKAGSRKWQGKETEVWARPLEDGTLAVALFNRSSQPTSITAKWTDVGAAGSKMVRDLWQRKDLGKFAEAFTATVPAHGTVLVKLSD